MLKRILYIIVCLIVLSILSIGSFLGYLYHSANMKTPHHSFSDTCTLTQTDSLRVYKNNWLRHNEDGLWELYMEGNDYERGYAAGKLSEALLYYQEKVFVDQIKKFVPSDAYLKFLRFCIVLFNRHLGENVPEEYRHEIYGISQSCTHEYDAIGTPYERQLNYHSAHDLGHALQDYMMVGCSSFACWDKASTDGELLIGRNFDFYMGDDFARNKQVVFCYPEKGYKFASIGWPGMIGVLSGMNDQGLTVTINAAKSDVPTSSATPISILTREILQYASTIEEAYRIAQSRKTFVSESILIGSAKEGKAAIIEKSPEKIGLFHPDTCFLICTNHYQSETFQNDKRNRENIQTSDSPYRFERIKELLSRYTPLDPVSAVRILRDREGIHNVPLGLTNELAINQLLAHHSVVFQPHQLKIWISTSPWQCGKYICYDLRKVFEGRCSPDKAIRDRSSDIPADTLFLSHDYPQLLTYKQLLPVIKEAIDKRHPLPPETITSFIESNPDYYYVYERLGDYYQAISNPEEAGRYWEKALYLPIPNKQTKQALQAKIK